jgi:EAL domain-containing protein (putative c-di-GMP-specific phosphodiesterase class I)
VRVAVNLSPAQFACPDLPGTVEAALRDAGLPGDRLELEITENVLLHDTPATLETLHRLRALGLRICMDDFGIGYSSLGNLRRFPFDKIKIDKSFVQGLTHERENAAIVRAIAMLGQSLGMDTTAEGVENLAQIERLVVDGCTEMQGYFFSPPCPAAEVPALLATGLARVAA